MEELRKANTLAIYYKNNKVQVQIITENNELITIDDVLLFQVTPINCTRF